MGMSGTCIYGVLLNTKIVCEKQQTTFFLIGFRAYSSSQVLRIGEMYKFTCAELHILICLNFKKIIYYVDLYAINNTCRLCVKNNKQILS